MVAHGCHHEFSFLVDMGGLGLNVVEVSRLVVIEEIKRAWAILTQVPSHVGV